MILRPRDDILSIDEMIDRLEESPLFGFRTFKWKKGYLINGPSEIVSRKETKRKLEEGEIPYNGEPYFVTILYMVAPNLDDEGVKRELTDLLGEPSQIERDTSIQSYQRSSWRFRYDFIDGDLPSVFYLEFYRKAYFDAIINMTDMPYNDGRADGLREILNLEEAIA